MGNGKLLSHSSGVSASDCYKQCLFLLPGVKMAGVLAGVLIMLIFMLPTCTLCESKPKPIIARMIYHSSKLSPFYNATASVEDLARRETDISFERLRGFNDYYYHQQLPSSLITRRSSNDDDDSTVVQTSSIEANIIAPPETPLFMVELLIGKSPPVYKKLFLDTGSSLLWVVCSGNNAYVPSKSISYRELLCGMPLCSTSYYSTCQGRYGLPCSYRVQYGTGYNAGVLAQEYFKFYTKRSESVIFVLFGCATEAKLPTEIQYDGILGIGPGSTSILKQRGYYGFSYCLGNLSDPEYLENILIIWNTGTPALDSMYSTQLWFEGRRQYVAQLVVIGIASELVHIPFPEGEKSLAIFDTGAADTYLTKEVYNELEKAIIKAIGDRLDRNFYYRIKLCYWANLQRDLHWFPTISFHFLNDTIMDVGHEHLFIQQTPNVICLAVQQTDYSVNIIGVRMQQYFYVSYNLQAELLNIKRSDCKSVMTDDDTL